MSIDWAKHWHIFYESFISGSYKRVITGLENTAIIAVFGLLFGFILGCVLAIIQVVPNFKNRFIIKFLKVFVNVYIAVFRGSPIVVQLLVFSYVLIPMFGVAFENILIGSFVLDAAVIQAIIVFSLNSGAYISEIMRGGINSVDSGQLEAGRALGLSYTKSMTKIVIPQAFKNVLPTLGNEFITLIKETSVVSFIGAVDLYKAFREIGSATHKYLMPYLMLALVYVVLVVLISLLVKLLEKKLKKSERK